MCRRSWYGYHQRNLAPACRKCGDNRLSVLMQNHLIVLANAGVNAVQQTCKYLHSAVMQAY